MKKTILATAILTSLVSFGTTNDIVDVKLLEKRIERIERVLELSDFPTYCEFTNAVCAIVKNRNCGNSPKKFAAYKVLRRAGVDVHLFDDLPTGRRITYIKKKDLVKKPPKEGRIFPSLPRRSDGKIRKTLDDYDDDERVPWRTDVDDSDESRLKDCNPLLSDR